MCGKIKGMLVWMTEETSPTVQLNSLLLTVIIDAQEHIDAATADIVGACLMVELNDFVLVKLKGESVDSTCQVNPVLKKYVISERHNKVLYLQLAKSLYGCM